MCLGRSEQVVCGACGIAAFWIFLQVEAVLSNHRAQSPANVRVASSGHVMGHCKVKYSLCTVKQV